MAQAGLERGLVLLNQLDEALAGMLTPPAGTVPQQQQQAALTESADRFAAVAGQIERVLLDVRDSPPTTQHEQLVQEVNELEIVLANKEKLIKHSQEQLKAWKQTCDRLEELSNKTVFS